MRISLFIVSLWLLTASFASAETFSLTDGGAVTGDIVKFDDGGLMLKTPADTYTNIAWARFSQDALKQVSANPKIKPLAEPFLEPEPAQRVQKAEISVNDVKRMERPEPSLFGGLFKSPLGWFLLLVIYGANLFAAYEISIVKARSAAQVMGVAAVLPIIGPIIFLVMKINMPEPVNAEEEALAAEVVAAQKPRTEIEIEEASWKPQAEKKTEAQIFARGKFTFNKRFLETRFGDFTGAATGPLAQKFTLEVKTMKGAIAVERIAQIGQNEIILETADGQVSVPLADLQEVKLNPKH